MILIIGSVPIRPDKRDLFLSEVRSAARASLAEEGVSRYELVESVDEPNRFLLIEEYADEASLAAHSESEHLKALGALLGEVLAGAPDIRRFDVTGGD
jgi:quinol monooxygenase YgiN